MPWYEIVKIVHFLGLVSMAGYSIVYARIGPRIRGAQAVSDARAWLDVLRAARGTFHGGAGLLLLSGIALVAIRWRGPFPFATVGMVSLLVIWLVGLIPGRHLRAIHGALATTDGPVPPELRALVTRPVPWMVGFAINLATLGVLFIMTLKPGWGVGAGLVVGMAVLGGVVGRAAVRRDG